MYVMSRSLLVAKGRCQRDMPKGDEMGMRGECDGVWREGGKAEGKGCGIKYQSLVCGGLCEV